MQSFHGWCVLAVVLAAGGWKGSPTRADDLRPMAAVFASYQADTFRNELAWPLDLYADSRRGEQQFLNDLLPGLDRYRALLIGKQGAPALDAAQLEQLGQWIDTGGILLLEVTTGQKLFATHQPAWLGRTRWAARDVTIDPRLEIEPHALTAGIDLDGLLRMVLGQADRLGRRAPRRLLGLDGTEGGQALIHADGVALLWIRRHGKGCIIALGGEFSPTARVPGVKQGTIGYSLAPMAVTFWENLRADLHLTRRSQVIAQALAAQPATLWWRDIGENISGGGAALPPAPSAAEALTEISADLGRGEHLWREVFLSLGQTSPGVRFAVDALTGPEGATLPGDSVQVQVLAQPPLLFGYMTNQPPRPGYTKAPLYLTPLTHLPPFGEATVDLNGPETYTLWLRLSAPGNAAPGEYRGTLKVSSANGELTGVPLRLRVWPMHLPGPELLEFEYEHAFEVMPGGSLLQPRGEPNHYNDPQLLARCQAQLPEYAISVGQNYGYHLLGYGAVQVRRRDTGEPLPAGGSRAADWLRTDPLPPLDFSYLNEQYLDGALAAGLKRYASNYVPGADHLLQWARLVEPGAKVLSPAHQRMIVWYLGEYYQHLRERGYVDPTIKTMDEFTPESVDAFVRSAGVLKQTGFRVYTTTPSVMFDADSVRKLDPVLDIWMGHVYVQPYRALAREVLGIELDPSDQEWPYSASSVPGLTVLSGRPWGWLAAKNRCVGFHFHHFFRWYQNDLQPALAGSDRLYVSPAALTYASTVFQGRYYAQLLHLLDVARQRGADAAKVDALAHAADLLVSDDPQALIPTQSKTSSPAKASGVDVEQWWPYAVAPRDAASYERAKVRVFELLQELAPLLGDLKPSVTYGKLTLVQDGQRTFELVPAKSECWAPLQDQLTAWCGPTLPTAPQPSVRLVAGVREDAAVAALLPRLQGRVTEHYPSANDYAVFVLADAQPATVLIVGGDPAGVAKGARLWTKLLTLENRL